MQGCCFHVCPQPQRNPRAPAGIKHKDRPWPRVRTRPPSPPASRNQDPRTANGALGGHALPTTFGFGNCCLSFKDWKSFFISRMRSLHLIDDSPGTFRYRGAALICKLKQY